MVKGVTGVVCVCVRDLNQQKMSSKANTSKYCLLGLGIPHLLCLVHLVTIATLKSCNNEHYPLGVSCSLNCCKPWNGGVLFNLPVESGLTLSFNKEITLCDFDQSEVLNEFI